jgi:PEP-CTERM putative exosortase interaction domain
MKTTRAVIEAIVLSGALMATATSAQAVSNLVTNGSFETGNLTGWTVGGNNTGYPPAVVSTNSSCCFGESVPADSLMGVSPDSGGTKAVYFVDDHANQTLTQSIFLTAGNYEIGFDAYAPLNGFANPGDAQFSSTIAGVQLVNYSVHDQNDPGAWLNFSGVATVLTSGYYNVDFDFQTLGGRSADVLIDRVYVVATDKTGGIPITGSVPEPGVYAMMVAGLSLLGFVARRRKQ